MTNNINKIFSRTPVYVSGMRRAQVSLLPFTAMEGKHKGVPAAVVNLVTKNGKRLTDDLPPFKTKL